jgi:hypothetical protein
VRFIYDGAAAIEEWQGGAMPAASYVSGLLMQRGGQRRFYQTDAQGSVRALADASGAVLERVDYEAFGAPLFSGGAGASAHGNPNLWQSLRYDADDELYVLGGRRYDPATARHLQPSR